MVFSITDENSFLSPSSNNVESLTLILDNKHKIEYCYKYNKIDNTVAYVLNPRIDFLVITIKVNDEDVKGTLTEYLAHDYLDSGQTKYENFSSKHMPVKGKYYYQHFERSIRLSEFPGLAAIQAKPKKDTYNFLKLTLIPSRWSAKDVSAFWSYLEEITHGYITANYVAEHGIVRRIDWAVDFLQVETSDFHISKKTKNKRKSIAYVGKDGGIETYYIGPNGKKVSAQNSRAYIYDKKAKAIEKDQDQEFENISHSRFEVRLNKDTLGAFKLKSLINPSGKLKNRLKAYSLTDFQAAIPNNEKLLWPFFADSCKLKGIDRAILMLPEPKRSLFKDAITMAQNECWQPEKLWEAIRKHVNFILGKELD